MAEPAFTCDLCWFSFSTQEDLDAHVDMESHATWSLDDADDAYDEAVLN